MNRNIPKSLMDDTRIADKEKKYWLSQLSGELVKTHFPYDNLQGEPFQQENSALGTLEFKVPVELSSKLLYLANNSNHNLFMILLASVIALLNKYTGSEDIITVIPIYRQELEREFLNTVLVIRNRLIETRTFKELIIQVKKSVIEANEHLNYPVETLLNQPGHHSSPGSPLFETAILMENIHPRRFLENIKPNILFSFLNNGKSIEGIVEYNRQLYKKETIERIIKYMGNVLRGMASNVNRQIIDLEILSEEERFQLLFEFNNTETVYPGDKTVHELFAEQVRKSHESTAVVYGSDHASQQVSINYKQLNKKANQLARVLRNKGVKPNDIVAIIVDPSIEMIIGIMAVLKAGGGYLPIDPEFPVTRVNYMLSDSKTRLLLTRQRLTTKAAFNGETINLTNEEKNSSQGESTNPENVNCPGDPVYMIYTSGSTGQPKGVVIEHRNLVNYVSWFAGEINLTGKDRTVLTSSFSFDLGYTSIYPSILSGAELHLIPKETYLSAENLWKYTRENEITYMKLTPALFTIMANSPYLSAEMCRKLRLLVLGGEEIRLKDVEKMHALASHIQVMNHYGPTEATIGCAAQFIDFNYFDEYKKNPTIGKPIHNTRVYIVDSNLKLVPMGASGELCISGAGLARYYLNRPELTAEKFCLRQPGGALFEKTAPPGPPRKNFLLEGTRGLAPLLYRTGDLARWLPNGNIQFLGRSDHQVKIRGYRVELGEIENQLASFAPVKESMVVTRVQGEENKPSHQPKGEKRLVAYVVPDTRYAFPVHRMLKLEREGLLTDQNRWELPNKMTICCSNKNEAYLMYEEIFEQRIYLKNGITLDEGACIFDLGANIGLFSLFIGHVCKGAEIYAFEPLSPLYEMLCLNTGIYDLQARNFAFGIAAKPGEATFSYYPHASVLSGRFPNLEEEKQTLKAFIRSRQLPHHNEKQMSDRQLNELLTERLSRKDFTCQLKTLSQVIKDNNIKRIDLLKVVVEKSELEVLKGIAEEDWPRIRQLVLEVHDIDGRLKKIINMIESRGYHLTVEQDHYQQHVGHYLIYALLPKEETGKTIRAPENREQNQSPTAWNSPDQLVNDIRNHLKEKLPDYMIPSAFILLDEFPLTPNGKIDRKALPAPRPHPEENYAAPRDEVETKLLKVWSEVLELDQISRGIDAGFFEMGGHSLSAAVMISKIQKEFNIKMPLKELFRRPTVRELSGYIKRAAKDKFARVEPVEQKEYYTLSSAQKRLYIIRQMHEIKTAYNISSAVVLKGSFNKEKLENAIIKLTGRHESLRTSFELIKDEPVQRINQDVNPEIEYFNTKHEAFNFKRPFHLAKAPLFRVGLIKESKTRQVLLVDMHHIISDGISSNVLTRDFIGLVNGKDLPTIRLQYKDFSEWQNRLLTAGKMKNQETYWLRKFEGDIPVLNILTDYPRPIIKSFAGDSVPFEIRVEEIKVLKKIALDEAMTLNMVFTAIYTIFLSKLSNQEDIIVGTPVAGRRHPDLERVVGVFINTLAIRTFPAAARGFKEFLQEVKETTLDAIENQDYQFEDLVERVNVPRDTGRNPLFDVMFVYHNEQEIPDSEGTGIFVSDPAASGYERNASMFDLNLHVFESPDRIKCNLDYCSKLFKKVTLQRYARYFKTIVHSITTQPGKCLFEIEMVPEAEKQQILYDFNHTKTGFSTGKTLSRLFEEQVEQTPDHIALSGENPKFEIRNSKSPGGGALTPLSDFVYITYSELNKKSNQLARKLREIRITSGFSVVIIDRSLEMIAAVLAILKAGGAYVPLEPYLPDARIIGVLKTLRVKCILTDHRHLRKTTALARQLTDAAHIVCPDEMTGTEFRGRPDHNLPSAAGAEDIAYIIYTSGSTGVPKGVMVKHRPVINVIQWVNKTFQVGAGDKLLFIASLSFDLSVYDIFGILACGGSLRVISHADTRNPARLLSIIFEEGITFWDSAPASFQQLLPFFPEVKKHKKRSRLRLVFLSGDWIPVTLPDALRQTFTGVKVISLGGATEATIWSNYYPVGRVDPSWNSIPYGKPIQNAKYYILDQYLHPCAIGVAGDLYIGGECLATAYLNDVELTSAKFIHSPFTPGERIYKTGDMARWYEDGNMEFLGRRDLQVKIRGQRIELGEIESQLLNHENIKDAVVVTIGNRAEDKTLCAYIVSDQELTGAQLKTYLAGQLPAYMIPIHFVPLQRIPLTPNGKADRKGLPHPSVYADQGYTAPREAVEHKLVDIWSALLNLERSRIGIDNDFFKLGGHSLKAAELVSLLHKEINLKVSLTDIFRAPTIRDLAEKFKDNEKELFQSIPLAPKKDYYTLSSSQKRLFFMQQIDPESTGYNITMVYQVEGDLSKEKLEKIFHQLIHRHESLRTSFPVINEEPVQKVHEKVQFKVRYYFTPGDTLKENPKSQITNYKQIPNYKFQITNQKETDGHHSSFIIHHFIRPFDLSRAPLLRVGLVKPGEKKYLLMVDIHHIIADGIAQNILTREFLTLYASGQLPLLKCQYKDYAEWQDNDRKKQDIKKQEKYWLREFAGQIPVLKLPTDFERPEIKRFQGEGIRFQMSSREQNALNKLAYEEGATLYMVLLALYNILLAKLSGQEDIIVGTAAAGRRHADIKPTVGMFVNTLALRNFPEGNKPFVDFLREVKERTLQAFENQDYQFEMLVQSICVNRDSNRNPLFDVMFALNSSDDELENSLNQEKVDFKIKEYKYEKKSLRFDMLLTALDSKDKLAFLIEYSTELFKKETVQRFIKYLQEIVKRVVENKDIKLKDIKISPDLTPVESKIQQEETGDFDFL